MKEDVHIQILEWANKNPGFTLVEITKRFPDKEEFIERETMYRENSVFERTRGTRPGRNTEYILSFEGRFKLLQHEELQEARTSSKKAMIIAIASVLLTFAALSVQVYYTICR
jgi:hypothetical protein